MTLRARLEEEPLWTGLELCTLGASIGLFVLTLFALSAPPGQEDPTLLLAVVAGGAAITVLWTVLVPLVEAVV